MLRLARALGPVANVVRPRAQTQALQAVRGFAASAAVRADPFPLPFDPALAAQHAAERATRQPEDVIEEWALPPPLDRTGESAEVTRARLVYQTRKRGTLEADLLLSTFARDFLPEMSVEDMQEFDKVSGLGRWLWRNGTSDLRFCVAAGELATCGAKRIVGQESLAEAGVVEA